MSPGSDQAAFGKGDGSIIVLNLHSGKTTTLSGRASSPIYAVAFSRNGDTLASANQDGTISVWNARTRTFRETLKGHTAAAEEVAFSPDGRTLYTAGYDGSVIVWDLGGARLLAEPFRYQSPGQGGATGSAVSPNGSIFAVSPRRDHVRLWDAGTRTPMAPSLRAPVGWVSGIAFSPDGKLVAAAGYRRAAVWDTKTRQIIRVLTVGQHGASAVSFSPDGLTLAVGRKDGVAALYDLRTGRIKARLPTDRSITDLAFSPDGKLIAAATWGGTTYVWNVANHKLVSSLSDSGSVADFSVRFSTDNRLIAVGDGSGRVVFWKLDPTHRFEGLWAAPQVGQPLTGHNGRVTSLDFGPGGSTLVTSSGDGKLRLWDVATRKLIGAPLPVSNTGGSVHFFPDGRHVLGVFGSGTGVLWSVDPVAWATKACSIAHRNLTPAEWSEFLGRRRYQHVCP